MTDKQTRLIHLIYGIALSLLIVALGVCFALSCLDIYQSGESSPFTPEAIKSHFVSILVPTILSIVAIIGGACLHIFLPAEDKKLRSNVEDKVVIRNLSKRINFNEAPVPLVKVVKSQRGFRRAFLIVTLANAVINAVGAMTYLFSSTSELTDAELKQFAPILPIVLTTLSYAVIPIFVIAIYIIFANFTYEKELEAVRAIIEHNAKNGNPVSKNVQSNEKCCFFKKHKKGLTITLQCLTLVIAIAFIISGIFMGELLFISDLAKAICMGCIGLG